MNKGDVTIVRISVLESGALDIEYQVEYRDAASAATAAAYLSGQTSTDSVMRGSSDLNTTAGSNTDDLRAEGAGKNASATTYNSQNSFT